MIVEKIITFYPKIFGIIDLKKKTINRSFYWHILFKQKFQGKVLLFVIVEFSFTKNFVKKKIY